VRANFECFADSISGGGEYIFSDAQKLQNVQVLEAICTSAATNNVVKIDD
jgi:hypothetical protein